MSESTEWPTQRTSENTPQAHDARSDEQHHEPQTEEDTVSGGAPEEPD